MRNQEVRYHRVVGDKVASVFIDKHDESDVLKKHEYIGICVSGSKETNVDWWNGKKKAKELYNVQTGNINTIMAITNTLSEHIYMRICSDGEYVGVCEPTDPKRRKTYKMMIKTISKQMNCTSEIFENEQGELWFSIA